MDSSQPEARPGIGSMMNGRQHGAAAWSYIRRAWGLEGANIAAHFFRHGIEE